VIAPCARPPATSDEPAPARQAPASRRSATADETGPPSCGLARHRHHILRDPNPHLGYGGYGTHYCLGAKLAKLEIELIFTAIADAMPGIAKAGDPVRLRSGWINGVKTLPVSYRG